MTSPVDPPDTQGRRRGTSRQPKEKKPSKFDLAAGLALRNRGVDQVIENSGDFVPRAMHAIVRLGTFSGAFEGLREYLEGLGIVPHTSQAWAALSRNLIGIGWLRERPDRVPMRSVRSHGRQTSTYDLCLDGSPPPSKEALRARREEIGWKSALREMGAEFEREFPELRILFGGAKDGMWHCWFKRADGAANPVPARSQASDLGEAVSAGFDAAREWSLEEGV